MPHSCAPIATPCLRLCAQVRSYVWLWLCWVSHLQYCLFGNIVDGDIIRISIYLELEKIKSCRFSFCGLVRVRYELVLVKRQKCVVGWTWSHILTHADVFTESNGIRFISYRPLLVQNASRCIPSTIRGFAKFCYILHQFD